MIEESLIKLNKVKIIKKTEVVYKDNKTEEKDPEFSRYYINGNIYRWNNSNTRKDFIYNKKDLLVTTVHKRKNSKSIITEKIVNYNYDKNDNLLSIYENGYLKKLFKPGIEEYYINDNLERKYIFNDKNLNIKREYYSTGKVDPIVHHYKYNDDDKLVEKETEYTITSYFYNKEGKISGFRTVDKKRNDIIQEFYYDYEDNKVKITSLLDKRTRVIEYNEKELPIKDTFYNDGNIEYEYIIEYTYY